MRKRIDSWTVVCRRTWRGWYICSVTAWHSGDAQLGRTIDIQLYNLAIQRHIRRRCRGDAAVKPPTLSIRRAVAATTMLVVGKQIATNSNADGKCRRRHASACHGWEYSQKSTPYYVFKTRERISMSLEYIMKLGYDHTRKMQSHVTLRRREWFRPTWLVTMFCFLILFSA